MHIEWCSCINIQYIHERWHMECEGGIIAIYSPFIIDAERHVLLAYIV